MSSLKPLADRVLVKPDEAEQKTASGLYIASNAQEKPQRGTIVAVGAGKVNDKGERIPMDVKVGDDVIYGKFGGNEVKVDGEKTCSSVPTTSTPSSRPSLDHSFVIERARRTGLGSGDASHISFGRFTMAKDIKFDADARSSLPRRQQAGRRRKGHLGPKGRYVALQRSSAPRSSPTTASPSPRRSSSRTRSRTWAPSSSARPPPRPTTSLVTAPPPRLCSPRSSSTTVCATSPLAPTRWPSVAASTRR